MDGKERAELIRQGNVFFNERKIKEAIVLFVRANYKDGLARVGDYFWHEKKEPVKAIQFYKKANHQKALDLLYRQMAYTLQKMLYVDDLAEDWNEYLSNKPDLVPSNLLSEKEFGFEDFSSNPVHKNYIKELNQLRNKLENQNGENE